MSERRVTITRTFGIDAGHRVFGHEGKCANLHGHRYTIGVVAQAEQLDRLGRVVDFSVLKDRIGGWLDAKWDHAMVVSAEDYELRKWLTLNDQKHYTMARNPTAENMALHLLHDVAPELMRGTGITVVEVTVQETPNCSATARR